MADKPKSTSDILASIRNKGGPATPPAETGAPVAPAPAATAGDSPAAAPKPTAKPAGDAPKGTSSILASIRSGAGGAPAAAKADAPKAAAASAGPAPKGTSGILASIRGGGGGKADAAPAAAKPAAKAAPKEPAGDQLSMQAMIKGIREGVKAPEPGQPKVPAKLLVGKPVAARAAAPVPRRSVFAPILAIVATPFALAWSLMAFLAGVFTLKGAQFMMPNMVLELPSKFKVGVPSDFPLGGVSEKYKAARGIWIVHTDAYDGRNEIYALASVCTHLGCTPSWLQGEQKFKCPCHGSGFYITGINFEGPAPRPLERVGIRMSEDGQIEVDKSVKFQEELGQWADTKSYIELV